jgi:hypothetical protein
VAKRKNIPPTIIFNRALKRRELIPASPRRERGNPGPSDRGAPLSRGACGGEAQVFHLFTAELARREKARGLIPARQEHSRAGASLPAAVNEARRKAAPIGASTRGPLSSRAGTGRPGAPDEKRIDRFF